MIDRQLLSTRYPSKIHSLPFHSLSLSFPLSPSIFRSFIHSLKLSIYPRIWVWFLPSIRITPKTVYQNSRVFISNAFHGASFIKALWNITTVYIILFFSLLHFFIRFASLRWRSVSDWEGDLGHGWRARNLNAHSIYIFYSSHLY